MSTMVTPGGLPPKVLTQAILCTDCETDRRPLMFICTYHEGWWDGWEAAHPGRTPPP